ncbi:MAG: HAMP domain-containing protein [Anaerolineae bacterium]|nr:HAMP domain-containing protein [Anaerolineae bacterium]
MNKPVWREKLGHFKAQSLMSSLRTKALLVTLVVLALCFIAIYVVSRTILERGYQNLERQAVQETLYRGEIALKEQIGFLANITRDYGHWDDTYDFAESGDRSYINSNLQSYFFESFKVDVVLFIDEAGTVVYQRLYDPEQPRTVFDVPAAVRDTILSTDALFDYETSQNRSAGLIATPQGIMLAAAAPIVPSTHATEPNGSLIFARFLQSDDMAVLIESVGHELSLYDLAAPDLPADVVTVYAEMLADDSPFRLSVANDLVYGYRCLNDLAGNPLFMLRVSMARNIYLEGVATQNYFLTALLLVGLIFVAFTFILLDGLVISRIGTLTRRVREIAPEQHDRRIEFDGNDEVAQLAQQINVLLQDIEHYDETMAALNEEMERKNVALRAEQEHKDRFFAHLSHELRTPLSNIKLRLYLIKKQPERAADGIAAITQLVDQIAQLVGDMVEMSHMQRGIIPIEHQPIDFQTLVNAAVTGLNSRIARKELRVNVACDTPAPMVDGDPERLGVAVSNITRFCVQSAEAKSEIRIQLSHRVVENMNWSVLSISCQTQAFRAADLYDLLMPFFVPTEADKTGTRLHLSLAKTIIEMHMGRIRLETDEDDRKKFIVALPRLTKSMPSAQQLTLQAQSI